MLGQRITYFIALLFSAVSVRAHGIGETFEGLTKFMLMRLIFGGIEKSVHLYDGIILDEVAGFVVHVILWSILLLYTVHFLSTKKSRALLTKTKVRIKKSHLFIVSLLITITLSHFQLIYFFVFILKSITHIFDNFSGIISITISYMLLMLVVFFLNKQPKI